MSMAWEVTTDDVQQVCEAHGVKFTDEIFDLIDAEQVEDALLNYVDFDNQVAVALCDIEDQLIKAEVVSETKKFPLPDGPDEWNEEDE